MTRALAASTLLFVLSAYALPSPAAHNPNNPNRHLLSRAITTDTSLVDGKTFDFVIVGGGTAGLAIAARLTESSNITVAVIEAGGDGSAHADNITIPGYSYLNGLSGSDADWSYTITNQSSAGNRATKWPRGKVLGGSGSTNGMFWGIGAQQDWDAWSTLFPTSSSSYNTSTLPNGTPASFAWNWKNIQSYFKKCETFHAPPVEQQNQFGMTIDPGSHGTKGPIQTTMSQWIFEPIANWVPTLVNVGMKKGDLSTGNTNVASITPSTLNPTNFTRSNSLAGYITPAGPRSNLVILTGFQATGLVWGTSKTSNNAVATGVNFAASANSQTFSVKAAKEVILRRVSINGGVIGSAQLLQLSGVGPKALTDSLNIKSIVDLPGVGQNLQDHEATSMTWAVDGQTWFDLMVNPTLQAEQLAQWRESGTGMWTYINEAVAYPNIQDVMGTAASTWISSVSSQLSSALTSLGQQQSLDATVLKGITEQFKIQLEMLQNGVGQLEIIMTMLAGQGNAGIQFAQQHAWSRGELKITSASAFDYPTINPNYFSNGWDVDIMNAGLRFVRRVGGTAPMNAYLKTENAGTSALTTDEAINAYLPNVIATGYHPIGTCSMLPLDMGGVVDTTLRVYGTSNVRVIDASVMPIHVTAHTMAPAYAIAEYGADIIKMAYWPIPASSTSTAAGGSGTGGAGSGNASTESSGLSSNQRTIVIATTIGAAAVAAILGLLFFIRRRKANKQAAEDPHRPSVGGHNRTLSILQPYTDNPRSAVPMQTLSQSDLNAPIMPFKGGSKESYRMSASTMDTAQLHAATPMHEHQSLHYDGPHTPGYAYNSQGEFNPYAGSNAPGTPHMGPAPGLAPGNGHEYAPVSGRASPASGPRI